MISRLFVIFVFIILISVFISGCTDQEINELIKVEIDGKGVYQSIQEAIDNSSDGDTIYVHKGIFNEIISINKTINLIGDPKNTYIEYNGSRVNQLYIIRINADNCTIKGLNIINKNQTSKNLIAIDVYSSNNNITENNISKTRYAIYIYKSASNNMIYNNHLHNNKYGIYTSYTTQNHIVLNNISFNSEYGTYLQSGSDNNFVNKNYFYNNKYALRIKGSERNNVFLNLFYKNNGGLWFCCGARNNIVYNNSFKNSTIWNGKDDIINQWDNGEYGNYWDDYNGTDYNGDGIGDVPYKIDRYRDNEDNYPLMSDNIKKWPFFK